MVKKYILDKYFWKWYFVQFKHNNYSVRTILALHILTIVLSIYAIFYGSQDQNPIIGLVVNTGLMCITVANYMNLYEYQKNRTWDILKS